jgi:hypothetical protein
MNGDLPPVCICCGAPATAWRVKEYSEYQPAPTGTYGRNIISLAFHIRDWLRMLNSPKISFRAPFCQRHENHLETVGLLRWSGIAGAVVAVIGFLTFGIVTEWSPVTFALFCVLFAAVLIGIVFNYRMTFHMQAVSREELVLHHVHEDFLSAVEAYRQRCPSAGTPAVATLAAPMATFAAAHPGGRNDAGLPDAAAALIAQGSKLRRDQQTTKDRAHFVAEELGNGVAPGDIETQLLSRGDDLRSARFLVQTVLEALPKILLDRYVKQYYLGILGLIGGPFLVLLALILWVAEAGLPLCIFGTAFALIMCFLGALLFPPAQRKLKLADQLMQAKQAWRPAALPAAVQATTPSGDMTPDVVHAALFTTEQLQRLKWIGYGMFVPIIGVLLLMCAGVIAAFSSAAKPEAHDAGKPEARDAGKRADAKKERERPPVGPNDGSPADGWMVLFRSADPTVWNTESQGARKFAIPAERARLDIRFLRLKRTETGETLIIPITRDELLGGDKPPPGKNHWWNGTGREAYGARLLGIAQGPAAPAGQKGLLAVAVVDGSVFSGSGFGGKAPTGDHQHFFWMGKEIRRTMFEIAVTSEALTEAEMAFLVK